MSSVTGDKELTKQLTAIARGVRKATRRAVNKGLTVIRKAVADEAPVGKTRSVKKSIGKRLNKLSGSTPEITGKVGPGVGKKKLKKDGSKSDTSPHAHLAVLGTVERFTKRGASRGIMPQNDFVSRGFARSQTAAAAKVEASFASEFANP